MHLTLRFELTRIILFTSNMEAMSAFYGGTIGLELVGTEEGWLDYKAGACHIALHAGQSSVGRRPPKIVFYASDVAAARAYLIARGMKGLGRVMSSEHFDMFNGKDPDGNAFQISSRP